MLETVIGIGILVVVIVLAKTVFGRNGSTTHSPKTGGGTIDEGTGTGDGSVTPPKNKPDAE